MSGMITLCTDFGTRDGYVAAMKGVILTIAPETDLIDISHGIAPQNVHEGAWVLATAYRFFPHGTVHLAVVDPGVGTDRRPIVVRTAHHIFVAPDNGLLSHALRREEVLEAVMPDRPEYWRDGKISHTFHGRDLFAPVAAHLARGIPLTDIGSPAGDLVTLDRDEPYVAPDGGIVGHIIHIDHFGNAISNIPAELLPDHRVYVHVAGHGVGPLRRAYGEAAPGHPLALIGSHDYLEIATREGDAARTLGLAIGDEVRIIRRMLERRNAVDA